MARSADYGGSGGGRGARRAANLASSLDISGKTLAMLLIFAALAIVLIGRLAYLQIIKASEYSALAQDERTASQILPARRGTIYDRKGNILAIDIDGKKVLCDPSLVDDPNSVSKELETVFGGKAEDYLEQLTVPESRYAVIAREATDEQYAKFAAYAEEHGVEGFYTKDIFIRQYPYGQVGGQVVGACSRSFEVETEDELHGICGLEAYYDEILAGQSGRYVAELGRTGTPIAGGEHVVQPAKDGQDIVISIDIELQGKIEERLTAANKQYEGKSCSCLMLDAASGEILVAASLPYFNPADRSKVEEGATSISCINTAIEPGSVFKTISAMAILEAETMTPDTEIFCPAEIPADEYKISDAHDRGDEIMSLRDIIDRSSNVGISLAVEQHLGFDRLNDAIASYQLNEFTGVDFPGEANGYLLDFDHWSKHQGYCITFGQGVSVTPLQITRFYTALLNDGYAYTPHFLTDNLATGEKLEFGQAELIKNKEAIPQMVDMLKGVVSSGTGRLAAIGGYNVAGKTSTAEIASEYGGYREGVYNLGFIGFLADSTSSIVTYVGGGEIPYEGTMTLVYKDIIGYYIDSYRVSPL